MYCRDLQMLDSQESSILSRTKSEEKPHAQASDHEKLIASRLPAAWEGERKGCERAKRRQPRVDETITTLLACFGGRRIARK